MVKNYRMKSTKTKRALYGTFQLNGSLALHSWYPYITGYSAEFVLESLKKYKIKPKSIVLDFFGGVGTTSIVCKKNNINSISIDLSPLVCFVARTKLNWHVNIKETNELLSKLIDSKDKYVNLEVPEDNPLNRYFSLEILKKLLFIKNYALEIDDKAIRDLFLLALIRILKSVSNITNSAPYFQIKNNPLKDAKVFDIFSGQVKTMIEDLSKLKENKAKSNVICGDSKEEMKKIKSNSIDFVITSPPYLNNWDYMWITKIEDLFLDFRLSRIGNKFVKSSTYLLNNSDYSVKSILPDSKVRKTILLLAKKLKKERIIRSGGKRFDTIVISYFNDMYTILKEMQRVMKKGSYALIVLGDSGLYGIHVKTDEIIGDIGKELGLKLVGIELLRKRTASRHKIPLRESVVIFKKVLY